MSSKLNIFVSYAEEDEAFKKALDRHTAPLRRNANKVAKWESSAQKVSVDISNAITQLQNAHIIIILASSNYLGNDDLWNGELQQAMQRHQKGTARIIPIDLKNYNKSGVPFGTIQGLPRRGVVDSPTNDEAWVAIVKEIIGVVDELIGSGIGIVDELPGGDTKKTPPMNTTSVKDLISQGKIAEVIAALSHKDEITILAARFNRNENDRHNGIIDLQEYRLELNRITNSLLAITTQLGLLDLSITAANTEKNTPTNITRNETVVTGDGNIVITGSNNNTFNINSNGQNQQVKDNKPPQLQQAITFVIRQEFSQAFDLLDTLALQNPLYYQLKQEYTSGVYRNDPHYADRLITFMNSL